MAHLSRITTVLIAFTVALSLVAAAGPIAAAGEDNSPTQTIETMENGEDLYLAFGADLNGMSLDEYIAAQTDDGASASGDGSGTEDAAEVIQYQDVGQVNVVEEGEAVSVAIGGGNAVAIQDVSQQNANTQDGSATATSEAAPSHESVFENVGDVYLVVGENGDRSFDGWAITDEDGDVTASQTAVAGVTQSQSVDQANVVQNATAFSLAEDDSDATAVQFTEQSNLNLQEGSANATNVLAADLDGEKDRHEKHKKGDDHDAAVEQTAEATIEQSQTVNQSNTVQQGAAVAIAVGENSTATAIQLTEQSNLNEQLATAEAVNVVMDSAGMNIAMASIGGSSPVVAQEALDVEEPKEKNDGDHEDDDLDQVANASVVQFQSAQQANLHVNSSATAIATAGSSAEAVQLTFQQNVNAQVASADALNIFLEPGEELPKKGDEKDAGVPEAGEDIESMVVTETTAVTLGGDQIADANRTTFDYDGPSDQFNDVEQWTTAEVEQSQQVVQLNYHANNAVAVADDDGEASALQITIQENENAQVASSEATTINEGQLEDDEDTDADGTDHGSSETSSTTEETQEATDEGMPGFGVAVALVALISAAAMALRSQP